MLAGLLQAKRKETGRLGVIMESTVWESRPFRETAVQEVHTVFENRVALTQLRFRDGGSSIPRVSFVRDFAQGLFGPTTFRQTPEHMFKSQGRGKANSLVPQMSRRLPATHRCSIDISL